MKRLVEEGTWFAVPLESKGYAVGLVARARRRGGILVAYFFGRVWQRPPALQQVRKLRPEKAIKVLRVGDLGFLEGSWPVIGRDPSWQRDEWPLPAFVRRDTISGVAWRVRYSDRDPSVIESETPIDFDTKLESAGLYGAGAAEIALTKLLGS